MTLELSAGRLRDLTDGQYMSQRKTELVRHVLLDGRGHPGEILQRTAMQDEQHDIVGLGLTAPDRAGDDFPSFTKRVARGHFFQVMKIKVLTVHEQDVLGS